MSKNLAAKVEQLVKPLFTAHGELKEFELVDVEYKKEGTNWYLRIFIDIEGGVTLDHCQLVSKYIDHIIESHDPIPTTYFLEVSSPGIDRSLKKIVDFQKFTGSLVKVKTYILFEGKKEFTGILQGVKNDQLVINDKEVEICIPLEKVAAVNLTIE